MLARRAGQPRGLREVLDVRQFSRRRVDRYQNDTVHIILTTRSGGRLSMSREIRWTIVGALVGLFSSIGAIAEAQTSGTVEVTLQIEAVSIAVTGGNIDFGGPWGSNAALQAHPQESQREAIPPTITNNGNVDITSLVVAYSGTLGQEASCDSGAGTWAAHASSAASDRFVMRAWASTNTSITTFNSSKLPIDPATGSGNVLSVGNAPLAQGAGIPLQLEIVTPNPALVGATGCTIGLSVTASAS